LKHSELARRLRDVAYLEGDFVLRSGKRSSFYLDKYLFATRPDVLEPLGRALAATATEVAPEALRLAGPELGAVPLVTAASLAGGLPFVIVRSAAKDYGTAQQIEGSFAAGETVCLLEDVVTTGGAALEAIGVLREAGLVCKHTVCVVDRQQGGAAAFEGAGVELRPLFTIDEIRDA
jgi:orotate phosphoribosyltransferase